MEPSQPPLDLAEPASRQRWRSSPPPLPKRALEQPAVSEPVAPPVMASSAVAVVSPPATTATEMVVDVQHSPGRIRRWLAALQSSAGFLASFALHVALLIALASWMFSSSANQELVLSARQGNEELDLTELNPVVIEPSTLPNHDTLLDATGAANAPLLADQFEDVVVDHDLLDDTTPKVSPGLIDEALSDSQAENGSRVGSLNALDDSSFGGMVDYARENGLDIVIAFDSTGSMGNEIAVVKQRIQQIGTSLIKKIPGARISLCTYKDISDEYLVRGVPLTSDLSKLLEFWGLINAGGGGDHEEAVQAGLKYATRDLEFRANARKVILIFGDAPPHKTDLKTCLALASTFHRSEQGIVTTITVRNGEPLPEFVAISKAGGGASFAMQDTNKLMEELIVQVFGSKHRQNAMKFFDLEPPAAP